MRPAYAFEFETPGLSIPLVTTYHRILLHQGVPQNNEYTQQGKTGKGTPIYRQCRFLIDIRYSYNQLFS